MMQLRAMRKNGIESQTALMWSSRRKAREHRGRLQRMSLCQHRLVGCRLCVIDITHPKGRLGRLPHGSTRLDSSPGTTAQPRTSSMKCSRQNAPIVPRAPQPHAPSSPLLSPGSPFSSPAPPDPDPVPDPDSDTPPSVSDRREGWA